MKTKEEWLNAQDGPHTSRTTPEVWVEQIQLDAAKSGMSLAHKIQQSTPHYWECGKAILTARDNLKLEDLK